MSPINGGQVIVDTLARFGLKTVFTLHAGHHDAAYQAARQAGFRVVDTRHEQAAGFAASAFARTTGSVGVAWVAAGGGVTNIVSPVANAFADCVPMVIIGGAAPLQDFETLPVNSGVDQLAVMRGVTKWAFQVPHISRLSDLLGQAIRKASTGRPGPVYIDLPIDVMFGQIDPKDLRHLHAAHPPLPPAPSAQAVKRIVDLLRQAKRPVIMAGGGVLYSGGAKDLVALAERGQIPVLTNAKARGTIPTDHPLWGRGFATLAPARGKGLVPDVILVLGARFGIYTGGRRKSFVGDETTVIQVDIEPGEIGRNRDAELAVAADCAETLTAVLREFSATASPERQAWAEQLCAVGNASKAAFEGVLSKTSGPIHPYRLARDAAEAAPRNAVWCLDGGESHSWIDMTAHSAGPGLWLGHGYVGSMGEGPPLAIGAQVAHPDRRVILFTGDGSVGFNFAEFETMVRHKLPVVVVIANNQAWGMSANGQDLLYGPGKRMVSDLGVIRYERAAAGFGCHSEFVDDVTELVPALKRALASGLPACVNVMTQPDAVHPITPRFVGKAGEQHADRVYVPYADDLEA